MTDKEFKEMCAKIKAHYPEFVQILDEKKMKELSALPRREIKIEVHQGRCQVLQEMCAIFKFD